MENLKSIEKNEVMPLVLLFIHSFLNGIALVFFKTTANTLFLIQYNISELPYVYILTALTSVIAGYFYTQLEKQSTITKLLKTSMLFVILIVVFFLLLIKFSDSKLAYMGIMVSKDLIWMFIGMEFVILTGIIFNIRQGKRLFGILMSGEILAGILGGFSIGFILDYINTEDLLFISVFTLIASFWLLLHILNKYSNKFETNNTNQNIEDNNSSYKSLFQNKYYLLFFTISVLSFFIFYFIDYIFYHTIEEKFTNENELASFFGVFYSVLNIVNLFSSLFLSGAILSRYGLGLGIMVIPILAIIGTSSLLIAAMASLGIGFILLVILKLLDEVVDISILNPTYKIIYRSIPIHQRIKIITFRETIIGPTAMGLAGLSLLGLSMLEGLEMIYYLIIMMSLIWLILGKLLKKQYVLSVEKLLNQREVFSDELELKNIDINIFLNGVKSKNEIEVIYCLDLLTKIGYKDIDNILTQLLSNQSVRIRLSVLKSIDKLNKDNLIDIISTKIEDEHNPEVLNKLLKLYCKIKTVDSIEKVSKYVQNTNSIIQEGAIVGLIQHGGVDGILVAGKVLHNLFDSIKKDDKILALKILAKLDIPSFYKPLEESLNNQDKDIRVVAIQAVGHLKIKKFLPNLLDNLILDSYRSVTIQALIKFKCTIFNELVEYFNLTKSINTKIALVKILSMMKIDDSYKFLLQQIEQPLLNDIIIEKLFETNFTSNDEKLIKKLLTHNIKKILFYLNILILIDKKSFPNSFLVIEELKDININNIFLILGFKYPKNIIIQSKLNYKSNSGDQKAYAVEAIDNMLSSNIKELVLPILEDKSIDKKIQNYSSSLCKETYTQQEFIDKVLEDENTPLILKLSILYELGTNKDKSYIDKIKTLTKNRNYDINQTAIWSLRRLNDER